MSVVCITSPMMNKLTDLRSSESKRLKVLMNDQSTIEKIEKKIPEVFKQVDAFFRADPQLSKLMDIESICHSMADSLAYEYITEDSTFVKSLENFKEWDETKVFLAKPGAEQCWKRAVFIYINALKLDLAPIIEQKISDQVVSMFKAKKWS